MRVHLNTNTLCSADTSERSVLLIHVGLINLIPSNLYFVGIIIIIFFLVLLIILLIINPSHTGNRAGNTESISTGNRTYLQHKMRPVHTK